MKTVIICTLFLVNSYLFAQTKKGILLGYHESIHASKNGISFRLSPQVGYFLHQKWLIGASLPPSYKSQTLLNTFLSPDEFVQNKGIVSPFVRRYLFDDAKWQFFLQGAFDVYRFTSTAVALKDKSGQWNLGSSFTLGLTHFVGSSVSLDFCYARPLLKGRIETLPINKTPYLKLGINYHWKVKNNLKEVN